MPLFFLKGDATEPQIDGNKLIVHICNDLGKWGKGFVMAISKKWIKPQVEYKKLKKYELGNVQFIKVEDDIFIGNMIAQKGINIFKKNYKRRVQYDDLKVCLNQIYVYAKSRKCSVHMPKIGTGLGGGEWSIIEKLIKESLKDVDTYIYEFK